MPPIFSLERDASHKSQTELLKVLLSDQYVIAIGIIQDSEIKFANQAMAELFGYSRGELMQWNLNDLLKTIHSEDRFLFMEHIRKQQTTTKDIVTTYSYRIITKSGEVRWVEEYSMPFLYEGKAAEFVTFIDISTRKQTGEALQESERRYRLLEKELRESEAKYVTLVEHAKDGLAIAQEGIVKFANQALAEFLGLTIDELVGLPFIELVAPESKELAAQRYKLRLAGVDVPSVYELKLKAIDETVKDVEVSVGIIQYQGGPATIAIVRDITMRKEAENALRESEVKYHLLFDNAPIGIGIANAKGNIIAANHWLAQLTGYSLEELRTINVRAIYADPHDRDQLLKTIQTSDQVCDWEVQLKQKDGSVFYALLNIDLIELGGEKVMLTTIRNISERKQAENALRQAKEDLELRVEQRTTELRLVNEQLRREINERKRAEAELYKLSQFLESIIDNTNVWLDVLDAKANVLIWNKAAEAISGYSRKEVIGHRKVWEWLYPDETYRTEVFAKATAIIERGEVDEDDLTTIRCKDGQHKIISWYSKNLVDENGTPIGSIAIGRDITERKQAEEALREGEAQLRAQYKGIPVPTYTWQRVGDDFVLADYNDAAYLFTERNVAKFIGKTAQEMYHDTPKIQEELLRCYTEKTSIKREMRYQFRLTGQSKDLAVSYAFVPPDLVMVHTEDITERKRIEETLRKSEQQYRATINSIGDAIHVIDKNLQIILVNPALKQWVQQLGLETNLIGRTVRETFPFLPDQVFKEYRQVFNTGEPLLTMEDTDIIGRKYLTETRKIPIIGEDGVTQVITIVRDITERKQAEEALRESEAKYSSLVENAKDGVIIVQDGVFQFANRAMADLSGYKVEKIVGKPFLDFVAPESRHLVSQKYLSRMAGEKVSGRLETKIQCKDETIRDVELTASMIKYNGLPAATAIVRDITSRKQAEEAKHDLEERRANFIAITSHELRTPLTVIKGYGEILAHKLDELDDDTKIQCFRAINRNVRRLERLISGVTTLGQFEKEVFRLEKTEMDFFNFLTTALQPYQTRLENQLEVRSISERDHVDIEVDPDRLLQVLDNLLENAVKHTHRDHRKIIITSEIYPQVVCVKVTDNGAGISSEDLERIFEPFVSIPTKFSVGGTGIGLNLSRMIVEAHGGTLTAYSDGKGQGATFVMELPRKWKGETNE